MDAYLEPRGTALSGIVAISKERMTIGRATDADVSLASDTTVSRLHSAIERYPGGWVLRDLGSTNGTFLNGERLSGDRPLKSGDEIRVGSGIFVFHSVALGASDDSETVQGVAPPVVTRREHEVLVELCRPLVDRSVAFGRPSTVAEIATRLFIGQATVKFHLDNLFDKFGLVEPGEGRRLSLANEAMKRGAVTLAELRQPAGGGNAP
jgi:pSer/pThr/pTyr-binding forkhead associated (FHA) protein